MPRDQWDRERDTPWGRITYIEYRRRMEFGEKEFEAIDRHCRDRGILWFASCWDEAAVDFMERFEPPCYKVASACLTDHDLLRRMRATGRPADALHRHVHDARRSRTRWPRPGASELLIAHATSTYPCPVGELNLRMIHTLRRRFPECPIGYSGHETGLSTTWAAVTLGATFVERHVTLDRAMWGSDQAASVEVGGFMRLVSNIRDVEKALGDGMKRVYAGELPQLEKLRRVKSRYARVS